MVVRDVRSSAGCFDFLFTRPYRTYVGPVCPVSLAPDIRPFVFFPVEILGSFLPARG
jgi:hypothetical protein